MFVYLCLCCHYKPGDISAFLYCHSEKRRGGRLPDSFMYTLPLYMYIHPKNLLYTVHNVEANIWKYFLIDTDPPMIGRMLPGYDNKAATD